MRRALRKRDARKYYSGGIMIKEILDEIRTAEAEAEEITKKAAEDAKQTVLGADEESRRIRLDAIRSVKEERRKIAESAGKEGDEKYFTETLAQIYIRQGRYSKALEIIKRLNLNYPKKNAYFADQIRFLEKLIINNKYK